MKILMNSELISVSAGSRDYQFDLVQTALVSFVFDALALADKEYTAQDYDASCETGINQLYAKYGAILGYSKETIKNDYYRILEILGDD